MNICFFGMYDREYSRNRVLIKGLEQNGCTVTHCNVDPRRYGGIQKYIELVRISRTLSRQTFDAVLVAFPGHTAVWLAKILFWRSPVVFDMFVSLYNSNVEDRRRYEKNSLRGLRDRVLDWHSCVLADKVLLDTNAHIRYVTKKYRLDSRKFLRIFVGTDDAVFYPSENMEPLDQFLVHFHGSFIPLQGVETIIRAAKLLEGRGIRFRLVGDGPEHENAVALAKTMGVANVTFTKRVLYGDLRALMNEAHICLGVFGTSPKTNLVIPNKVFEAAACGRAVITVDSPAIRELFRDNDTIILCAPTAEDLAEKIETLQRDTPLRTSVAETARCLFVEQLTPREVSRSLVKNLFTNAV